MPKKIATCVIKDEKGNITAIGFDNTNIVLPYQVAMLSTRNGDTNLIISQTKNGKDYLKTIGDSEENNLDSLPICGGGV
jgi:hypothetical protein